MDLRVTGVVLAHNAGIYPLCPALWVDTGGGLAQSPLSEVCKGREGGFFLLLLLKLQGRWKEGMLSHHAAAG